MRKLLFAFAMCLLTFAASAQEVSFESLKAQLCDKSLPLINLNVEIDKVSKPEYTNATIEIADPQKRTDKTNVVTTFACKVKYRGNSAVYYDKKSFGVKLLNTQGEELDANLFGLRKSDTWILNAMAIDRLRMRDRVNFDVWNDMSATPYSTDLNRRNGTKGIFVELFINGSYQGLYCFTDKVNRKLLGLKKTGKDDDGKPVIKGVLYKGKEWGPATFLYGYKDEDMNGAMWNGWELEYPEDHPCPDAYMPLKDFIDYSENSDDDEFKSGINKRFYWQNFIDYQVFLLAQGLTDNYMKNTFLSIVNTQKGRCMMVTPWDLDCSLGGYWDGSRKSNVATLSTIMCVGLYNRLWKYNVNNYKSAVAGRWRELHETTLSEQAFCARLDAYASAFIESGAWQREYNKWNGNPVELQQDLTQEVNYVKDWYKRNCRNLDDNIYHGIASEPGAVSPTVVDHDTATGTAATFNLAGQKVDDSYKGIVIKNRKKILRR